MKVVVIGGTGAFGSRLCDVLSRDGDEVTVASRNAPQDTRFPHLRFDRNGPLDRLTGFDVVVDAAGPFHGYGDDPYRIAMAAIGAGAHYFDLSDNADFCAGITTLDTQAQVAGVSVVSGMSSVPAVSSAAVTALCNGMAPLMIDAAILPGNKAPRGRSVVDSILNQTGQDYEVTQGGQPVTVRSWSDPRIYDLAGEARQAWRIEVPDQRLFPQHFDCPTVSFRAGLELGIMRYGLAVLSWLRANLRFGMPRWLVTFVMWLARLLGPFGTDTGGMVVDVTLPERNEFVRRTWTMTARNGDGPFTPAIAVRAACRNLQALPSGAYPALGIVTLDQIETCFSDLDITTETSEQPIVPPFKTVLGKRFMDLDVAVRTTHDAVTPRYYEGRATVTRGKGLQARIAATLFGFPPTGDDVLVSVSKTPSATGETWVRRFGTSVFRSYLSPTNRGMSERFGLFSFDLDLTVQDGKLNFPVKSGRCMGIPIPRALLPGSEATEYAKDGKFHFDVHLKAPTGATLVHYRGWLMPKT
ncbi:DUF4166 domain-containing protein [Octadecabacter sp.]|nr:DUF4166 domain-containing protein [Octadecabacter sp.]